MTLKSYSRKRDFRKTSEPPGNALKGRTRGRLRFVVQKHAASRLHYDFRLEMKGVLKSWAVPKGPSLDPSDKRLAVHVEDHPFDYRSFEGTIPKGEYGGGTVMVWDEGTWRMKDPKADPLQAERRGKIEFLLEGKKLRGEWHLFRMSGRAGEDGKNWLLVKSRDKMASTRDVMAFDQSAKTGRSMEEIATKSRRDPKLPDFVPPELATLTREVPAGDWIHEIKFDGYRIQARVDGGRVRLLTRTAKDWTRSFPGVAEAVAALSVHSAILDGEIVSLLPSGLSSFQALQNALSEGDDANLVYYVFDLLYLDGKNLRDLPLEERRKMLRMILKSPKKTATGGVRFSESIAEDHAAVFREACRQGLEGIISKKRNAPYHSGRGNDWVKTKCHKEQEFVIVGYSDPQRSRPYFGALLLAVREKGKLRYSGMVGTGFSHRTLSELHGQLKKLETKSPTVQRHPAMHARVIHWVKPKLVSQVEFTEWTDEGLIRHPSFKGLREDKPAAEVVHETPVKATPSGARAKREAVMKKPGKEEETIEGVRFTHPDKILYPDQGLTKRDLAHYYVDVADRILPCLKNRPASIVRCPTGSAGKCFYQKHVVEGTPEEIDEVTIRESGGTTGRYVVINDVKGLVAMAQMGVLEVHPWGARVDDIEKPDQVIFDFDPGPGVPWAKVVEGGKLLRGLLEDLGLKSFAKVTGGKGLHVVVPVQRKNSWDEIKEFAHQVAVSIEQDDPAHYVTVMTKSKRHGKIFLDYLRNNRGATAVAPYSTRARPGAPVAVPIFWEELSARLKPDQFNVKNVRDRLKKQKKDPWEGFFSVKQGLKNLKAAA